MKFRKLLKKLKAYMDVDSEELQQKDESLSKVLKKLKREELLLKEKIISKSDDDERELLEQHLKVIHSQRKKGITLLSTLRKEGDKK